MLGWWWLNNLLEVRPRSEAGSIVGGVVSIAGRLVYPGKQVHCLSYEVLEELENTVGNLVCRAQRVVAMSNNQITITGRTPEPFGVS